MNAILLRNVITYLFNDNYGHFNWSVITALVAIAALAFNEWDSHRKYKADLISENRTERLQFREDSATFISNCILYAEYSPTIEFFPSNVGAQPIKGGVIVTADPVKKSEKSKFSKNIKNSEIEKLRASLNMLGNKLLLCIYEKEENTEIINDINEILNIINKEDLNSGEKTKIKEKSINLRDNLSRYFSNEWEKVKIGK